HGLDLGLPNVVRKVLEDVEHGIVLSRCQWQFQDVADEIRHHRATSPALNLEVANVGNRHVVGDVQCLIPVRLSVHGTGSKPSSAKLADVPVDALCAPQEFLAAAEKQPVMIEVVYVDLAVAT